MTSIRVLIVDDHPLVREGVVRVLEGEPDIRVVGRADTLGEARRLLGQVATDVIILDLALGANDGMELLREVESGPGPAVSC